MPGDQVITGNINQLKIVNYIERVKQESVKGVQTTRITPTQELALEQIEKKTGDNPSESNRKAIDRYVVQLPFSDEIDRHSDFLNDVIFPNLGKLATKRALIEAVINS